jgi:predicted metal-dependent phosphoesterase TrpH
MTDGAERWGRADLHVHTRASDAIPGIQQILDHVESGTDLDLIAITDHERIDAALAAREMVARKPYRFEVIVGEEVTTLNGHLLALFIERRIMPMRPLGRTVAEVHRQGGIAIASHPLAPYPNCISSRSVRRLNASHDPSHRLDGLETFNPTSPGRTHHDRAVALAAELHLAAVGGSDAHLLAAIGSGYTTFPGRTAADLRRAILERTTDSDGAYWTFGFQVGMFRQQLRKYSRDVRDQVRGTLLRDGTGRDLGYPGGRRRPERFDETELE